MPLSNWLHCTADQVMAWSAAFFDGAIPVAAGAALLCVSVAIFAGRRGCW